MEPIVVVGAGASAVHFAQTLVESGRRVTMLDIGKTGPAPVEAAANLRQLKASLPDPVSYFLGKGFESALLPGDEREYYGFPPSKQYIFEELDHRHLRTRGFHPLMSHAAGGLAQAWTGGCYPLTAEEVADFPFDYGQLKKWYGKIAARIGVNGERDDLAPFFPWHDHLQPGLDLDPHSRRLVARYERRKASINQRHRCFLGRSRIATLSRDLGERPACSYLNRCLWGCPQHSLYTPSLTLRQLRKHENFTYLPNVRVDHFRFDAFARVQAVVYQDLRSGQMEPLDVGSLVLSAGALASAKIVLDSVYRNSGEDLELTGLMDNRQVFMPFVNFDMLGHATPDAGYQYHLLSLGLPGNEPLDYVHAQITTLKSAMVQAIAQSLPLPLSAGVRMLRLIRSSLGLANINFSDTRRAENRVRLAHLEDGRTGLELSYQAPADEESKIQATCARIGRVLRQLNCYAPRVMRRTRPMGASVHYGGLIPMTRNGGSWTADEAGRCRAFTNLYLADGITFPVLPAKNLTFTLMANAARIAEEAFLHENVRLG